MDTIAVDVFAAHATQTGMQQAIDDTPKHWRWLPAESGEGAALVWSFVYFFALLSAYFILRPVRDALGTDYDTRWLFLGTFVCMLLLTPLYGALVAHFPRRRFLPLVYGMFVACLVAFWWLMEGERGGPYLNATFFVWVAVFNLFAVSVFWSFMSDIFDTAQAKRMFGAIAAGGTTGTLVGSLLTMTLATRIGTANLLLVSAGLLILCIVAIVTLIPWARRQESIRGWRSGEDAIGGSVMGGAMLIQRSRFLQACCLLTFFGVAVGTLLYNLQREHARVMFPDSSERALFFSQLDFAINLLVLLVQLTLTRVLLTRYGVGPMLIFPVLLVGAGFAALIGNPTPLLLSAVQVVTRAGNFALIQPARESLFTRVDRESRYKSKNFIDTVVYRGGDLTIAWVYAGLTLGLGFQTPGVALFGIVMAAAMFGAVWWVVKLQHALPVDGHEAEKGAGGGAG
jgi:AAA family ATP:ADP antiporter